MLFVAELRVRLGAAEPHDAGAPCAHHKLTHAERVGGTARILFAKPLVVVVVPAGEHVPAGCLDRCPNSRDRLVGTVTGPGGEPRLVQVTEVVPPRVRGKVVSQPGELGRACATGDLTVEGVQPPGPAVERVILIPGADAVEEVVVITLCVKRVVLVVARCRASDRLEGAPGRVVLRLELD